MYMLKYLTVKYRLQFTIWGLVWVTPFQFTRALRSPSSWTMRHSIPRMIMALVFSWNPFRFSTSTLGLVWDWMESAESLFPNWGSSVFSPALSDQGKRPYFRNRTDLIRMPLHYRSPLEYTASWFLQRMSLSLAQAVQEKLLMQAISWGFVLWDKYYVDNVDPVLGNYINHIRILCKEIKLFTSFTDIKCDFLKH